MPTESRGVLNELQIRGNLHNVAGICQTKQNHSAYGRRLAPCLGSARCVHRQGRLESLLMLLAQLRR